MLLWQRPEQKNEDLKQPPFNENRQLDSGFCYRRVQLSNGYLIYLKRTRLFQRIFLLSAFVHTEDKDSVNNALQGAVNGEDYNIEYRIVTAKGNLKYVNERTFTIFDRYKKPVRVIGIIEQIPSKSKDSIGMDKLKRKYGAFDRESCDMFALVNDKGQIKYASESLSEVIGYDGSSCLEVIFDIFNTKIPLK